MKKEQLIKIIREEILKEASEVELDDLNPNYQKIAMAIMKIFNVKRDFMVWDGVHGRIIKLPHTQMGSYRFEKDELVKLSKLPIRWMDSDKDWINVGF